MAQIVSLLGPGWIVATLLLAARIAAVLLLTPVFLPLAHTIGMDAVQLGLMMVLNLAIGLYTPPVGTTLFITSSIAKVKVGATVRAMVPFYLVAFVVLALVSYVPAFVLR